jgi:signal transduction histidine kinase
MVGHRTDRTSARSMSWRISAAAVAAACLTAVSVYGYLQNPPSAFVTVHRSGFSHPEIVREVAVAWAFIGAGLLGWMRRPRNRVWPLMVAVGCALLLEGFQYLPVPALVTLGMWLSLGAGLGGVLLGVLVLAFPDGRIGSRLERGWVALAGIYLGLQLLLALITPYPPLAPRHTDCLFVAGGCPRPLLVLTYNEPLRIELANFTDLLFAVLALLLIGLLARRGLTATRPTLRRAAPIWLAGAVIVLIAATGEIFWSLAAAKSRLSGVPSAVPSLGHLVWDSLDPSVWGYLPWVQSLSLLLVPLAILLSLFHLRLRQSAVSALAVELGRTGPHRPLVDALRRALGDPSLQLAFWSRPAGAYVSEAGEPMALPSEQPGRAVTRLAADDGPLAALIHDPALAEQRPLIDGVAAVARLSIENERLHAEVKAQLEEVRASRERIVRAADEERRRVERNLHDGAQQRLVSLSLALSMAQAQAAGGAPTVAATLTEAEAELRGAIAELRELARGIHPAVLAEAGLAPALEGLAEHSPVPVRLELALNGRLSPSAEATAYFVAAEALTNVAKHAAASRVELVVRHVGDTLRLVIDDDGIGGADPARGSGLRGLLDRVAALGGRLSIEPGPAGGTRLTAEIPCG